MKHVDYMKIIYAAAFLTALTSEAVNAGPGDEPLEIPATSIRKGPNVGKLEKLTYKNGQFTALVDGKSLQINRYDVDKPLRDLTKEQLKGFLVSGKLMIGRLEIVEQARKSCSYSIKDGSGLPGGGGKETLIKEGFKYAWRGGKWVKTHAWDGVKWVAKEGPKQVWNGSKWVVKEVIRHLIIDNSVKGVKKGWKYIKDQF